MMAEAPIAEYKLLLVGDHRVGKTTLVKRLSSGVYNKKAELTLGTEVTAIDLYTTSGRIRFNVWDVGGFYGPRSLDYINIHDEHNSDGTCAIIMFEVVFHSSYKSVADWFSAVTRLCGHNNMPIVIIGNKVDVNHRKLKYRDITFPRRKKLDYYDISVKSNYNITKPFLRLARKLTGNKALELLTCDSFAAAMLNYEINRASRERTDDLITLAWQVFLAHWYSRDAVMRPPATDYLPPRAVHYWLDTLFNRDHPSVLPAGFLPFEQPPL